MESERELVSVMSVETNKSEELDIIHESFGPAGTRFIGIGTQNNNVRGKWSAHK